MARTAVFATGLTQSGDLLQVWVQRNRNAVAILESPLEQYAVNFNTMPVPDVSQLTLNAKCIAYNSDGRFYRARIIGQQKQIVTLHSLDYGFTFPVDFRNMRLTSPSDSLMKIPEQAEGFFVAGVATSLNRPLEPLKPDVINCNLAIQVIADYGPACKIAKFYKNEIDIASIWLVRGFLRAISIKEQEALARNICRIVDDVLVPRVPPPGLSPVITTPPPESLLGNVSLIKALAAEVKEQIGRSDESARQPASSPKVQEYTLVPVPSGAAFNVTITHIADGPWSFSVQLRNDSQLLAELAAELEYCDRVPLKPPVVVGKQCIVQSKIYGSCCRGVIVGVSHSAIRVSLIDYGAIEELNLRQVFQAPSSVFDTKVLSHNFSLAQLSKMKIANDEYPILCDAFSSIVTGQMLRLQVTPTEENCMQNCDLFLGNQNIKLLLNRKMQNRRTFESEPLPAVGDVESIYVTHVLSNDRFYIQLKKREETINIMSEELQHVSASAPPISEADIRPGLPCLTMFPEDMTWYRGKIRTISEDSMNIFFIDYGNEMTADSNALRLLPIDFIKKLPAQAICCGLHDVSPSDKNVLQRLNDLMNTDEVTMVVKAWDQNKLVVDIFASGINVAEEPIEEQPVVITEPAVIDDSSYSEFKHVNHHEKRPTDHRGWNDGTQNQESEWRRRPPKDSPPQNRFGNGFRSGDDKWEASSDKFLRENWRKHKKPPVTKWEDRLPRWSDNSSANSRQFDKRSSHSKFESGGDRGADRNFQKRSNNDDKFGSSRITNGGDYHSRFDRFENESGGRKNFERPSDDREGGRMRFDRSNEDGDGGRKRFDRASEDGYGGRKRFDRNSEDGDGGRRRFDRNSEDGEGGRKRFDRNSEDGDGGRKRFDDGKRADFDSRPKKMPIRFEERAPQGSKFLEPDISPDCEILGSITYFVSPNSFFLQLEQGQAEFTTMMETLQADYANKFSFRETDELREGDIVIARFSADKVLYRAEVIIESPLKVRFVDYGNFEEISNRRNVYPVLNSLLDLPCQAIHCSIASIQPKGGSWPFESSTPFEQENLTFYTVSKDDLIWNVNVSKEGNCLAKQLISDGFAESVYGATNDLEFTEETTTNISRADPQLLVGELLLVHVPYVYDTDKFFVQFSQENVETIENNMANLGDLQVMEMDMIKPGTLCVSTVPDYPDTLYRAKVQQLTNTGAVVQFIDYGDYSEVPFAQIYEISEDVANWPYLAYECRLYGDTSNLSDEMQDTFKTIASSDVIILIHDAKCEGENVRLDVTVYDSTGAKLTVEENVNDSPLECSIPNLPLIFSPLLLNIMDFTSPTTVLVNMPESSELLLEEPESGEVLPGNPCAVCCNDGFWRRAIVTDGDAYLIDAGRHESVTDIRPLIPSTRCIPKSVREVTLSVPMLGPTLVSVKKEEQVVIEPISKTGFISHVETATHVFFTPESVSTRLDEIQSSIEGTVSTPTESDRVLAKFSDDGMWYRAEILSREPLRVRFIDYGNETEVEEIAPSPQSLAIIPPMAIPIILNVDLPEDSKEKLEEIVLAAEEALTLVEINGEPVDFLLKGRSVIAQLKGQPQLFSGTIVHVSHFDGPDAVYLQRGEDSGLIDEIANSLANPESMALASLPFDGLVAALFEDGVWYRARVVDNKLYFVDYGNSGEMTEVRTLPDDLATISPLAIRVSLKTIEGADDPLSLRIGGPVLSEDIMFEPLLLEEVTTIDENIFVKLAPLGADQNLPQDDQPLRDRRDQTDDDKYAGLPRNETDEQKHGKMQALLNIPDSDLERGAHLDEAAPHLEFELTDASPTQGERVVSMSDEALIAETSQEGQTDDALLSPTSSRPDEDLEIDADPRPSQSQLDEVTAQNEQTSSLPDEDRISESMLESETPGEVENATPVSEKLISGSEQETTMTLAPPACDEGLEKITASENTAESDNVVLSPLLSAETKVFQSQYEEQPLLENGNIIPATEFPRQKDDALLKPNELISGEIDVPTSYVSDEILSEDSAVGDTTPSDKFPLSNSSPQSQPPEESLSSNDIRSTTSNKVLITGASLQTDLRPSTPNEPIDTATSDAQTMIRPYSDESVDTIIAQENIYVSDEKTLSPGKEIKRSKRNEPAVPLLDKESKVGINTDSEDNAFSNSTDDSFPDDELQSPKLQQMGRDEGIDISNGSLSLTDEAFVDESQGKISNLFHDGSYPNEVIAGVLLNEIIDSVKGGLYNEPVTSTETTQKPTASINDSGKDEDAFDETLSTEADSSIDVFNTCSEVVDDTSLDGEINLPESKTESNHAAASNIEYPNSSELEITSSDRVIPKNSS